MYVATKGKPLATTITGSLPRPHWFTENLNGRPFLAAFNGDAVYREQYGDAVAALISDQTRAGLDVVTDGEMRFDLDIGGRSWFGYAFDRMEGLTRPERGVHATGSRHRGFAQRAGTAGDILSEFVSTLQPPRVTGAIGPGTLQYDAVWKAAQRLSSKPVKMGSCCGQMLDRQAIGGFYQDRREQLFAFSKALNDEYHRLADAGCAVIQVEEPCLHNSAGVEGEIPPQVYVEAFNAEVAGLRAQDRSVVPHLLGQSVRPASRAAALLQGRAVASGAARCRRRHDRGGGEQWRRDRRCRGGARLGQEDLHRRAQPPLTADRVARRHRGVDPQGA